MDLHARKLNVIEYLIGLNDEKVFSEIEAAILHSKIDQKRSVKPFTQEQIIERARKSNNDYLAGKIKTQEQLAIESENW